MRLQGVALQYKKSETLSSSCTYIQVASANPQFPLERLTRYCLEHMKKDHILLVSREVLKYCIIDLDFESYRMTVL